MLIQSFDESKAQTARSKALAFGPSHVGLAIAH
jgi:hypothetical protein